MSIISSLSGMIPAMVSPLTVNREIDVESLKLLVDRNLENGAKGVMILGTIGEGLELKKENCERMIENTVAAIDKRGVTVVGISGLTVEEAIQNARRAHAYGADIGLCIPPFYHLVSQDIIYNYYRIIADSSPIPIMIYNMPSLTKNFVEIDTISKLSNHSNIVGIKDSSGNCIYFQQLVNKYQSENFKVFMGRAPLILTAILLGATGTMTPIANLNPAFEGKISKFVANGQIENAKILINEVQNIVKIFSLDKIPIAASVKGIMSSMNLCEKYVSEDIYSIPDETIEKLYNDYFSLVLQSDSLV